MKKKETQYNDVGEFFVSSGYLSSDQLEDALEVAEENDMPLEEVLVALELATDNEITRAYEMLTKLTRQFPTANTVDERLLPRLPEPVCRKYGMLPLKARHKFINIAMVNPLNREALETARQYLGREVKPTLVSISHLEMLYDQIFSSKPTASVETELQTESVPESEILEDDLDLDDFEEEQALPQSFAEIKPIQPGGDSVLQKTKVHNLYDIGYEFQTGKKKSSRTNIETVQQLRASEVVNFLNQMLRKAITLNASDIHIEPSESELKIRFRVDGRMEAQGRFTRDIHAELVSRLKVMAGLDISEKRLPQDGKIHYKSGNQEIYNFRISTYPLIYGEKVVLRIHEQAAASHTLSELGMLDSALRVFKKIIHEQHGMILVTGPTGSGKTTTLYAALQEINDNHSNIITVEDPVESDLPDINQSAVNPKAGLTFPRMLRSILRQDPDIIMVGEIRDLETSQLAFRAAMTGHLVLSALHANDAASSISRLLNLGTEAHLVASSVIGVDAQRLIRKLCPQCKEEIQLEDENLALLERIWPNHGIKRFFDAKGCMSCNDTGHKGRIGVFEVMLITESVQKLIMNKESASALKTKAIEEGMIPMQIDAMNKLRQETISFNAIRPILVASSSQI